MLEELLLIKPIKVGGPSDLRPMKAATEEHIILKEKDTENQDFTDTPISENPKNLGPLDNKAQ